jgi:hypothetical protein
MRRLQVDYMDRGDQAMTQISPEGTDYSLPTQVLGIQRQVLTHLMSDGVAQRILDSESKLDDPRQGLSLGEMYDRLQSAIWSELSTGRDIDGVRRNLQREHTRRVVALLTQASAATPADARSLARENAVTLLAQLKAAKRHKGYSKEARAHLAETEVALERALNAPMQRAVL